MLQKGKQEMASGSFQDFFLKSRINKVTIFCTNQVVMYSKSMVDLLQNCLLFVELTQNKF